MSSKCEQPLKVLHICQRDDPATGGAVRVAVEYVKHLVQYDIDAHCLFLYGSPGPFLGELGNKHTHYLDIKNSKEILKLGRLCGFLQEFQPDIIHHHDNLLWPHLLTFFHPGMVKIVHAHLDAVRRPFLSRGALANWFQRHSTDALVCITEHTRSTQIKEGKYSPDVVHVVYNGVDQKRFYPPTSRERLSARECMGLPSNVPVIGFVGRLHCVMKGVDDFLRMIALLPPHYRALIVGSGPDEAFLKHLAEELGIAQRVSFAGVLKNPVLAYHAVDVFCLTSHWEPFGLVVAEAMACHIPVVGFRCSGGVHELLTPETGCVLPTRDLKAMARAVIGAVNDPEAGIQRSIRTETQLQNNHDWDKNALQLAHLYKQLVSETACI